MIKTLLLLPLIALGGAGCGGLAASQAVSPLQFLLPGLVKNIDSPLPAKPESNVLAVQTPSQPVLTLAKAK